MHADSLLVIVPSRGRPENIRRLIHAWAMTDASARLCVALDEDDPALDCYPKVPADIGFTVVGKRERMGPTLNRLALAHVNEYEALGFCGDDHLPHVRVGLRWDECIAEALSQGPRIVYCDDLLQRQNLPTQWFVSSTIVKAIGWMSLPGALHLFLDDAVKRLGEETGTLRYLDHVVIEHLHPLAGKAESDGGYVECNSPATWANDEDAFHRWVADKMPDDVAAVRALAEAV